MSLDSSIYIPQGSFNSEKQKILSQAKEDALRGIPKLAGLRTTDQDPYPSSYLSLGDYQIPKTMTEVFNYCRYFYKFDSLVGGAINALARFPVTDILFEDIKALPADWDSKQDSPTLALYKQMFDDLRISDDLIKIGIDYFLYGNCIIFGEFDNVSGDSENPEYRWKRMFRLDPSKVIIDIDPLTQEKTFKWTIPTKIRKIVKDKKPKDKYDQIPDFIKQAVKDNKAVILNPANVYHMSREGESGDGSMWGTPIILNVMKQLAYRNILRQAQEAIAREHIVPFRVYYFDPSERMDPLTSWNNVARSFGEQLQQAARDPNYKVVSPVPVNVLNLGGQGRALMLTAEIEQLHSEILAGMGVPKEFIFGGVSYSAASISLRTLENHFITYRLLLVDFLNNFVIRRMAEVRGEWRGPVDNDYLVTVRMAELKMQDDVQQKQMVISLNSANKISDEYMYDMLGIDADKMKVQLKKEMIERLEIERNMQLYNMETQFLLQQSQMQYSAALQAQMAPVQDKSPKKSESKSPKKEAQELDNGIVKTSSELSKQDDLDAELLAQKLAGLDEPSIRHVLSKIPGNLRDTLIPRIEKYATNPFSQSSTAESLPVEAQRSELTKLRQTIYGNSGLLQETTEHMKENSMIPLPTQKPPRRETLK